MFSISKLRQLTSHSDRKSFSDQYEVCSGLPIPTAYLFAPTTQVFGFYVKEQLVGGFILGHGKELRTVTLFAQEKIQKNVTATLNNQLAYTEICCLWMSHAYRKNMWINTLNWIYIIHALRKHARPGLVFGTCSTGLARLYASSQRATLIHQDRINRRRTYIFQSTKSDCFPGITNIIRAKLKRRFLVKGHRIKATQAPALVTLRAQKEHT